MSARGKWKRKTLEQRIRERFEIADNGCWIWTGGRNSAGYGMILPNGSDRPLRAHRAMYELVIGPIPEGHDIDHVCHNGSGCPGGPTCLHRRCVNPFHMEPVTRGVNVMRGESLQAKNARKTHCIRGHELSQENLTARTRKGRECRLCVRLNSSEYYKKHSERILEARRRERTAA